MIDRVEFKSSAVVGVLTFRHLIRGPIGIRFIRNVIEIDKEGLKKDDGTTSS